MKKKEASSEREKTALSIEDNGFSKEGNACTKEEKAGLPRKEEKDFSKEKEAFSEENFFAKEEEAFSKEEQEVEQEFGDILYREHPTSAKHPRAGWQARAAQFAPFAALTGFEEMTREAGRQKQKKPVLEEDRKEELDQKLQEAEALQEKGEAPFLRITYFLEEEKGSGKFAACAGILKEVQKEKGVLCLWDGTQIPLGDILDLEVERRKTE